MRSIIFKLETIPLEILFLESTKKYGNGAAHHDRWIPLCPVEILFSKDVIRLTSEGLVFEQKDYIFYNEVDTYK